MGTLIGSGLAILVAVIGVLYFNYQDKKHKNENA